MYTKQKHTTYTIDTDIRDTRYVYKYMSTYNFFTLTTNLKVGKIYAPAANMPKCAIYTYASIFYK